VTARWLYEPGGWIFGGLLVAALMVLQDLISLGSSDRATVSAGLAIALALPFHVSRLIIVRYFRDLSQAVAELTGGQAFSPAKSRAMDMAVSAALALGAIFTLIGISSALWRISWAATLFFSSRGRRWPAPHRARPPLMRSRPYQGR
jgi:hypothetical protein